VRRDPLAHINTIEQDGLSMLDLIGAMKADAKQQDELVSVIAQSLEDTVRRNDELGRVTEMSAFEGEKANPSPLTPHPNPKPTPYARFSLACGSGKVLASCWGSSRWGLTHHPSPQAPITPAAYCRRIMKYGGASPCCLAVGLIYLERLKRCSPLFKNV